MYGYIILYRFGHSRKLFFLLFSFENGLNAKKKKKKDFVDKLFRRVKSLLEFHV